MFAYPVPEILGCTWDIRDLTFVSTHANTGSLLPCQSLGATSDNAPSPGRSLRREDDAATGSSVADNARSPRPQKVRRAAIVTGAAALDHGFPPASVATTVNGTSRHSQKPVTVAGDVRRREPQRRSCRACTSWPRYPRLTLRFRPRDRGLPVAAGHPR